MNDKLIIPQNAVISATGATWLDESGIIVAIARYHAIHTLHHALENHTINKQLAGLIPRPFMIDMTDVKAMTHEARTFYAGQEPAQILTAVAILTTSQWGKAIGNAFMSLTKPILPTRLFTDCDEAKKWLARFIATENT